MDRKLGGLTLALLCAVASAKDAPADLELKGIRIGDSEDATLAKIGPATCEDDGSRGDFDRLCFVNEGVTLAGFPAQVLAVTFLDHKVTTVLVTGVDSDHYMAVRLAYDKKFGRPKVGNSSRRWQSVTWNDGIAELQVLERSRSDLRTSVRLRSLAAEDALRKTREQAAKDDI